MRLAIVHSHLRKGGVTKVIATTLEALGKDTSEVVVISSTEPEEPLGCKWVVVPELAYDDEPSGQKVERLADAIISGAREALGDLPELWHVHNHSLGKNVNFPAALGRILSDGVASLLQIHDFSEDGRPGNYAAQRKAFSIDDDSDYEAALYPLAPQIGYAVLNGRDKDVLINSGIPSERVFLLPNAVAVPQLQNSKSIPETEKPLILYPTRGIRRKNVGEVLLMAMVYPEFRYGTTLSPKNPQWEAIHSNWVNLANDLGLSVTFAMGELPGNTFEGLIEEAYAMLTTSVGEGFGLAFLEPWLFGKPLWGRDLPEITRDFKDNGVALPDLYATWDIPCELFDRDALRIRFEKSVRDVFSAYDRLITDKEIAAAWDKKISSETVDFGFLDEEAQAQVLISLAAHPEALSDLRTIPLPTQDPDILSSNALQIESAYGVSAYGAKLNDIYSRLRQATPASPQGLDAGCLLDQFLDLDRFTFLRT